MKKVIAVLATVTATVAVAVGVASASGGPLYEDSEFACGVLDRDGSFVLTYDSYLVWYASGKVYLRCEAWGTPGDARVTTSGFPCGLGEFGYASQSKNTVGREGHIQLTCTGFMHPDNEIDSASSAGFGAG